MSIRIGNNNTIKNSIIGNKSKIKGEKKNWLLEIIVGTVIAVAAGIILLIIQTRNF